MGERKKEEKDFYLAYLGNKVLLTKKANNRDFFYKGVVTAVLDSKLVLQDIKVGQVMFSFEDISSIEKLNSHANGGGIGNG